MKHSTINGFHGSYVRMHTWIKLGYWGKTIQDSRGYCWQETRLLQMQRQDHQWDSNEHS